MRPDSQPFVCMSQHYPAWKHRTAGRDPGFVQRAPIGAPGSCVAAHCWRELASDCSAGKLVSDLAIWGRNREKNESSSPSRITEMARTRDSEGMQDCRRRICPFLFGLGGEAPLPRGSLRSNPCAEAGSSSSSPPWPANRWRPAQVGDGVDGRGGEVQTGDRVAGC
jgi:hypothetical protein